jgi:photosystem II stability/assembly factor-like uncharacterized protein
MSECARRATVVAFLLSVAVGALSLAAFATPAAAATAAVTSPDGLWSWVRPLPFGYPAGGRSTPPFQGVVNSDAIDAPAPGTLFVATSVGDLLYTTDGGASWGWSPTGAVNGFAQPDAVDFVSPSEGWTAGTDSTGQNGMLLHTTDGGASWQSALSLPGAPLTNVDFSDPSSGWVIGGDDYEMLGWLASCTTDGGASWSTPAALPLDPGSGIDYSEFEAFAPTGPGSAVFMETDDLTGGYGDDTTVWRTTDGGTSWTIAGKLADGVYSMAFSSASDGWASGGWLWRTTDGGTTWEKVRPAPDTGQVVIAGSEIWVVGLNGSLHSSDGGATWTSSTVSGNVAAFADGAEGWVANGALYQHTTDGGATWTPLTSTAPPAIGSLSATPDGTVWGVSGRIVVSSDGGLLWRTTSRRSVNAVSAISAQQAWAVADNGLIIHTSDGGHHWTVQASHVRSALASVDFTDASHGWAGGAGGVILHTSDGGRHWHYTREAKGGYITQLSFAGAENGIALGRVAPLGSYNTTFLVTHTGGRTWSLERLPATQLPWASRPATVLMENPSQGLIIAFGNPAPQCFSTSDGGATWQLKSVAPEGAGGYVEVARSGSQLCAVSAYGGVATSSDDGATWSNEGIVMGPTMRSVQFVGADELMISGDLGVMTRDLTTAPLP